MPGLLSCRPGRKKANGLIFPVGRDKTCAPGARLEKSELAGTDLDAQRLDGVAHLQARKAHLVADLP